MAGFHLMAALVVRGAFDEVVLPAYAATGGRIEVTWAPTTVLQAQLAAGEHADAVLLITEAMDALIASGHVEAATRVEVATSALGVAVPAAQRPQTSSADTFRQALLDARSVAFSQGGASGIYFAGLIERMGIADAIRAKATIIPAGFTGEQLLTGAADLAVQQVSELMVVQGIDIVGPFPDAVQSRAGFSAAAVTGSKARAEVMDFLAMLRAEPARAAFQARGLEPAA